MPSPIPRPELFVNEDLSKPENRTNLALFGLMLIPSVRTWLLERLKLPAECILYPPQNVTGGRPDFVVVGPDQTVLAWIEVELGAENQSQLAQYRQRLSERVISVVGPEGAGGDLSLEKIASVLGGPEFEQLDRQQTTNVGVFTALVSALAGKSPSIEYVDPIPELRTRPLVHELSKCLGSMLQFGTPPATPGTALISTITQTGWTLKVYSKAASGRTVSLLWDQVSGKNEVRVPSRARLDRCFPSATGQVDTYVALCRELGADVTALGEAQSLAIDEKRLLLKMDRLAACVQEFATVFGGATLTDSAEPAG
jgi:hypothetical protein